MPKPFKFKQFEIHQDSAAFKVGTDACLLGAFVDAVEPRRILDIGTGTGVIALMLAQRYSKADIVGIERDEQSAIDADFNARQCPWNDRIDIKNADFLTADFDSSFDLIVSNPPFFTQSTKNPDERKSSARHESTLTLNMLLKKAQSLISVHGKIALILPIERRNDLLIESENLGLYELELIQFKPTESKPANRFISVLGKQAEKQKAAQTFTIYQAQNTYTAEVYQRFQPFYFYL